jgi:hypothetical protein
MQPCQVHAQGSGRGTQGLLGLLPLPQCRPDERCHHGDAGDEYRPAYGEHHAGRAPEGDSVDGGRDGAGQQGC